MALKVLHKKQTNNLKKNALVLAFDLGGTKLAVGVVDVRGKIVESIRVPTEVAGGKSAVVNQMVKLGKDFLARYPGIHRVGIASAGPLDPMQGVLLDPTNLSAGGPSWGRVPLVKALSTRLKRPVQLENDAAAAVLAEKWVGIGRKCSNVMILTLGTGLGTGVICNGELVRAGRFLHTEAGHLIVKLGDASAPCGCGNVGCAEAYLSGRNFARRYGARAGGVEKTSREIAELARSGDALAREAFEEYASVMAVAIHNFAVIYAPEVIVFTGSFAQTADLWMGAVEAKLLQLMVRRRTGVDMVPRLRLSKLGNDAGLIGGALIALR